MATIEKLVKAFEGLKVFQPMGLTVEDVTKKKDQPPSKKEKTVHCNMVADCICAPNMRSIPDFPKFLGIAVEAFLMLCDDPEADVRMVSDECLNRTIKTLIETNLGRLQVELYKEIKKNGPSRSLRAALWRFAEMCNLIRPQKCRPYIVNLMPCLARICKREEEAVQETLATTMIKICPVLVSFANDAEVKSLLRSFLPNLGSSTAVTRRTAATSLTAVCQHSRSPNFFSKWLLESLLSSLLPASMEYDNYTLLGVIQCLRYLLPLIINPNVKDEGMKGSFGVMRSYREVTVSTEQLLQVYELLLYHTSHGDHNVVTASLEALQQFLKRPHPNLIPLLTSRNSITTSTIFEETKTLGRGRSDSSFAVLPSSLDYGLEDEMDQGEDSSDQTSSDSPLEGGVLTGTSPGEEGDGSQSAIELVPRENSDAGIDAEAIPSEDDRPVFVLTESQYSNVEIGDVNEEKSERSEKSQLSHSSSQDTLLSIKSLSPKRTPSLRQGFGEDMNGNPEYDPELENVNSEPSSPYPGGVPSSALGDIGTFIDGEVPLLYCTRLLCQQFLLAGRKGELMADKAVRISIKSLALGCVANISSMDPSIFFHNLFIKNDTENQNLQEMLLFANHPDPQLKGQTALIIGQFIHATLLAGKGNFPHWVRSYKEPDVAAFDLDKLLQLLSAITEDDSSMAARLGLVAIKLCLSDLLSSCHCHRGLQLLLKLIELKNHTYWLVKVEMLELLGDINFRIIGYLESVLTKGNDNWGQCIGELHLQERVVNEVMVQLLGDEDSRVRHCAATMLVRLVPKLFYKADSPQESPVIGSAKQLAEQFFSPILHDWSDELPPLVLGLVSPYDYDTKYPQPPADVESSLSRIISTIVQQLHKSQSKFLTYGCCHALSLLSDVYLVTQFPHAWGCAPPLALSNQDSNKGVMKKPTSRSISTSSTISLDEIGTGSGGGPLPIILSLLTSASFSLDLVAHQDALHVAGHLFAGAAYRCLRPAEDTNNSCTNPEEGPWRSLTDRMLSPKAEQLLNHVAKLLNACTHVVEEIIPGPPQMKPSLPSLPNAPSLSPIKRRSKADKDLSNQGSPTSTGDSKNTPKSSSKDKDKESDKEKHKKDGIGTFYSSPHYMKLYDVLKGAYSNYKTSLDLTSSDKFCSLLHTALLVFSQILEVVTLQDIGKHAEELLTYLKSTVLIEATVTVQCVQQLLKALFGTNLSTQWETPSTPSASAKPGKATRLSANIKPGLYHSCFTTPYTQFTQSLAGAAFKATTQVEQEDNSSPLSWLRRRVDRKIPAILRPGSKTDKNAITSYIRLFEPLVIKALKQYTVTSSVELQTEVLDLLSQLIQLRVNYCLLDSDQIFIGFVIKQFEYIEEGQIRSSELVIPHIFQFLVILSYEKFHTKSIIGIPKIIQLCDGIMASGQQPTTHVIPALRPIVYDLFLLRGSNKGDMGKELDTQREVVVSMLLRLISYYQVLELLTIVLHQYHKEGEDKWKRLSRQVTDLVLPLLTKQQINLDNHMSVDVLHRLFESVAPSVFRPVDILLKALFSPPQDLVSVKNTQRWVGLILGVLRVLISQSKEEVILARLQELHLSVFIFTDTGQAGTDNSTNQDSLHGQPPEEIFAWYILQVVGLISRRISERSSLLNCDKDDGTSLCQGLAHLLLYLTYMFQSGLFRRVATAAMRVIRQSTPSCFFTINQINSHFQTLGIYDPTLTLQWCNTLILLNYDDQEWWGSVMQTPKKYVLSSQSPSNGNTVEPVSSLSKCFSSEIIRRGSLILFCDYVCENLTDADHMIWVIINHVNELIELSHEPPVQDFISAVHRNSAASGLFIQAIHARCDNFTKPAQMKRTLQCLEAIHLSQSGTLLTLLIDKFLNTHHLAVARFCDTIACRRVEMLLAENLEDSTAQLPLEDLEKLLQFMKTHGLCKRHARLVSLLTKLRTIFCPESCMTLSPEKTHPLVLTSTQLKDIKIDKDWFVSIVKEQCFCADPDPRECARLLQRLEYADTLAVIMTKEFNLSILKECISLSAYRTLVSYNRNQELREASPDDSTAQLPQQPVLDILFLASQMALFRHINNIINMLPDPHQVLVFDLKISSKSTHYGARLEDFFLDACWLDSILQIAVTVLQYLRSLSQFPWQPSVPAESRSDVCRFCILCFEVIHWQLSTNHLPSSEQLETAIHCMAACLQSPQLAEVFSQKDFTLWACTAIGVTHQILSALVVHPGERLAILPKKEPNEDKSTSKLDDSYYFIRACEEMSELIHCLRTCLRRSDGGEGRIPDCLRLPIRTIAIGLARLPVVNSYSRTPPLVWRMGWAPSPSGDTKTRLPPLPLDYIQDKEVLREFIFRVHSLGWTSRQQFEETWMALLGVLTPLPPEEDHHIAPEEDMERSQSMVLAVRAITGLLIQSSLSPQPGNPANSGYEVLPRDKPLAILHTRCGKKLAMVRGLVERELRNLCPRRHDGGTSLTYNQDTDGLKFLFESNLERELGSEDYALGQISVETIWSLIGLLDISASESESEESAESPPKQPQNKVSTPSENKGSLGGLDIHSCLQLLLELYGQWLAPNTSPKTPLMMLNAILKSIVCLSDLFSEVQQYELMLSTLLDVTKTHPVEDELVNQYLIVGICKAAAVCGPPDSSASEKIIKLLDFGLKSTHLSCKVTSLHGILYLLEAGMSDFTKSIISLTTDFLLKQLSAISLVCITSHQFVLTLWATAFYLIENYTDDLKEGDFQGTILQMAVNTISSGEENISIAVYLALFRGLERLLLSDVLSKQDADTLLKLAVDRLCLPSPVKALPALGLMLTCMYTGKHIDQYSPAVRNMDVAFFDQDNDPFTIVYQDPESLILAMERVTVLFDRIKKGTPYEARVITRILPAFLADFFPPQDIMNKVIGEFISNQQPHPQLIAKVVFQVFSSLHQSEQHNLVQDWVMLSLSNFTQRTPVAMAVWSLTCFLISASTNPWLRGLLPHIIGRMGKLEVVDRKFFCVSAIDFYRQLEDESKRRAFLSTFQTVAQPDSPYSELLACFSGL